MRPSRLLLLLALVVPLSLASLSCSRGGGGITVAGSTSVQPFAEELAEEYMVRHPGETVNVQGGGSSAGIEAATSGAAQIGMTSRDLKGDEQKLVRIEIARDAIAIVVHRDSSVRNLTLDQVRGIFGGTITNWSAVGGPPRRIVVVTREEGSGTRSAFQELVMGPKTEIDPGSLVQDSNGAVRTLVGSDPNAIGYISLGLVDKSVQGVSLDGVAATDENVIANKYNVVRPFLFVLRKEPEGTAKAYVDFVLSADGQATLAHEGLLGPTGDR